MNNPYSQTKDVPIDKLIEDNLDLVRKIVWQIHGRVHNVVEVEDLIQQGMEGLVNAAQKYSPVENVTFSQYAQLRIRGSIIDYLRKILIYVEPPLKKQEFEKAKLDLENSLARSPTQDEIAKYLGMSFDEFDYWQQSFEANSIQSLDSAYNEYSLLYATTEENPEVKLENKQLKERNKISFTNFKSKRSFNCSIILC